MGLHLRDDGGTRSSAKDWCGCMIDWMNDVRAGRQGFTLSPSLFIRYFMRGCERIKLNLNTQFGHKLWICCPQSIYGLHNIKNPRNWIRINWSKGGGGAGWEELIFQMPIHVPPKYTRICFTPSVRPSHDLWQLKSFPLACVVGGWI